MPADATRLDYLDAGRTCKGTYYLPQNRVGPLPVVLVCHAWDGLVEEVHDKSRKLAAEGYIAFAVDVLGEGTTKRDRSELQAMTSFLAEVL